jgi:alcohol dehydrogenase
VSSVKAAVMTAPNQPLEITTVELDPPGPGEVLLRVHASGVCHSDLSIIDGTLMSLTPTASMTPAPS